MTELDREQEQTVKIDFSYDLKRGYINSSFLYITGISTIIMVITVLMPLNRRIKSMIARILNWKFTYYGMELSIYSCIIIYLKFLGFCFCFIKMQEVQFASTTSMTNESFSTRIFKHKNKCLIDSELWMIAINIIEWITIYKYYKLTEYRLKIDEELSLLRGEPLKPKIDEGAKFRDIIFEKSPNKEVLNDIQQKRVFESKGDKKNTN